MTMEALQSSIPPVFEGNWYTLNSITCFIFSVGLAQKSMYAEYSNHHLQD